MLHCVFFPSPSVVGQWRRWNPKFVLLWTNVAALRVRSYGMRTAVRSWRDLPAVSCQRLGMRLEGLCVLLLCDYGRHWLLEASWKRSTFAKSPRVHPNLPSASPRRCTMHSTLPNLQQTFLSISISPSWPSSHHTNARIIASPVYHPHHLHMFAGISHLCR
jgi:hypothetical protein